VHVFRLGQSNILIRAKAAIARAQRTFSRNDGVCAVAANTPCQIGALMMRCPENGRTVNSGVFVQEADIPRLAQFRLSVRCPHYGEAHDICVGDAYIDTKGMLPRARPHLTVIARDVA
jgi:hypothetical protein